MNTHKNCYSAFILFYLKLLACFSLVPAKVLLGRHFQKCPRLS